MKLTMIVLLPAIVMTLVSVCMHRVHSDDIRNDTVRLGMFFAWSISSLLLVIYRAVRLVRFAAKRHQS